MRDYEPYFTEDGSVGLYSYADKDVYHSKFGALTEAWEKFVIPSELDEFFKDNQNLRVLDICYGIGYNTKALITFIIKKNKKKLKNNLLKKFFSKKKKYKNKSNIDTIDKNNTTNKRSSLLLCIDTIDDNKQISVDIDCLDINDELIKLSPLFKTLKTPYEIFSYIVPDLFDCLSIYYSIREFFSKFISNFAPKNRKEIDELLELKYRTRFLEKEYRMHKYTNYILQNALTKKYGHLSFDNNTKKIVKEKQNCRFFDKSMISYAKFNSFCEYYLSFLPTLSAFLHNIYYGYLSFRNKNINFKATEKLFNINFYINDARKTILDLNDEYDCIFLDAFTYTKAPQLWSVEFIAELYKRISPSGVLLTYSTSAQVRNTFIENGFFVGKIYDSKKQRILGTIASKDKNKIKHPLSNYELGLCSTKAGIPYHDPNLCFSNKEILEFREYEFRHSNLISSSKYMKMRTLRSNNEEI